MAALPRTFQGEVIRAVKTPVIRSAILTGVNTINPTTIQAFNVETPLHLPVVSGDAILIEQLGLWYVPADSAQQVSVVAPRIQADFQNPLGVHNFVDIPFVMPPQTVFTPYTPQLMATMQDSMFRYEDLRKWMQVFNGTDPGPQTLFDLRFGIGQNNTSGAGHNFQVQAVIALRIVKLDD